MRWRIAALPVLVGCGIHSAGASVRFTSLANVALLAPTRLCPAWLSDDAGEKASLHRYVATNTQDTCGYTGHRPRCAGRTGRRAPRRRAEAVGRATGTLRLNRGDRRAERGGISRQIVTAGLTALTNG